MSGCASCSRMARPQPTTRTISRLIFLPTTLLLRWSTILMLAATGAAASRPSATLLLRASPMVRLFEGALLERRRTVTALAAALQGRPVDAPDDRGRRLARAA